MTARPTPGVPPAGDQGPGEAPSPRLTPPTTRHLLSLTTPTHVLNTASPVPQPLFPSSLPPPPPVLRRSWRRRNAAVLPPGQSWGLLERLASCWEYFSRLMYPERPFLMTPSLLSPPSTRLKFIIYRSVFPVILLVW